jgi:hypothetical protein
MIAHAATPAQTSRRNFVSEVVDNQSQIADTAVGMEQAKGKANINE